MSTDPTRIEWGFRLLQALRVKYELNCQFRDKSSAKPDFNENIIHVCIGEHFQRIKILGRSRTDPDNPKKSKWRRWILIEDADKAIQREIYDREYDDEFRTTGTTKNRAFLEAANRKKAIEYGKFLLEGLKATRKKWVDDWFLVSIPGEHEIWRGIIRFELHETSKSTRSRRWKPERLQKLFASGLFAFTVRVNPGTSTCRIDYSAIGPKRSAKSEWFASTHLHSQLVEMTNRAIQWGWRDEEIREFAGVDALDQYTDFANSIVKAGETPAESSQIIGEQQHFVGGDVL